MCPEKYTLKAWRDLKTQEINTILDGKIPLTIDLNFRYITKVFDVFPDLKKQFCLKFSQLPKQQIQDTINKLNKNKDGHDILNILLYKNTTETLRDIGFFENFQEQKDTTNQSDVILQRNFMHHLCTLHAYDEIQDHVGSFMS